MDDNCRVKVNSIDGQLYCCGTERIPGIIENIVKGKKWNVNEIIELYNTKISLQEKLVSLDGLYDYKSCVTKIESIIHNFFQNVNDNSISDIINDVLAVYIEDFWHLFNAYKIYNRISKQAFSGILTKCTNIEQIRYILLNKNIVDKYDDIISKYMLQNISSVEYILSIYVKGNNVKKIYIPKSLTLEKKTDLLNRYIQSECANINYVKVIYEAQSAQELPILDKTRLLAKKRYEEEGRKILSRGNAMESITEIVFSDSQEDIVKCSMDKLDIKIVYGLKWIKENLDYPTILNNFIYIFEFVDVFFRINHVSKTAESGILEKLIGLRGKKEYFRGINFDHKQTMADLQFKAYYKELERNNISIEVIMKWFFENYLKDEFNAGGFIFNIPMSGASYFEKCKSILPEIDSILKQYSYYVSDGEINKELLSISSHHVSFKEAPSFLNDKYIYHHGDEYNIATGLLFSDQSILTFRKNDENNYDSFADLVEKNDVRIDNFNDFQKERLEWLCSHGYLNKEKGVIRIIQPITAILKDIYMNDVSCRYYIEKYKDVKEIIKEMKDKNVIYFGSTLLSEPESAYFNYIFNQAEFCNGLDLRNSYMHGSKPIDDQINSKDYFIILRMIILLIIKINDEFCLAQENGLLKERKQIIKS